MSLNSTVGRIREIVKEHEGDSEDSEVVVWYTLRVGFLRKLAWFLEEQEDSYGLQLRGDDSICIFGKESFENFEALEWMNEESPCEKVS